MRLPLKTAHRTGAVLPLVTVCLVGLMALVAFGIDVGMMAVARSQAQSAADIAAMAGTRTLTGQSGNKDQRRGRPASGRTSSSARRSRTQVTTVL